MPYFAGSSLSGKRASLEIVRFGAAAHCALQSSLPRLDFDECLMESELMKGFIAADFFKAVRHLLVTVVACFLGKTLIKRIHFKRLSGDRVCHILFVGSHKLQQVCLLDEVLHVFLVCGLIEEVGQFVIAVGACLLSKELVFGKGKRFTPHGVQQVCAAARGDGVFSKILLCHNSLQHLSMVDAGFREMCWRSPLGVTHLTPNTPV